ncbi:MAG: RIP metalloprotease RseP [Parvularculales bacterium]
MTLGDGTSFVLDYIIPFLVVLTIVVFFHELGHFLVARWRGVHVEVFSVGFGPEIFGRTDKRGTRWKVSWIPLGGYVKFLGDDNVASAPDHEALENLSPEQRAQSYHAKPVGSRAAIAAAGPIANFILTIVIFIGLNITVGQQIVTPVVDEVLPNSPAAESGFHSGDLISTIDGNEIEAFLDVQQIVSVSAGKTLSVGVIRKGVPVTLTVVPQYKDITDDFGNSYRVGYLGLSNRADADDIQHIRYGLVDAVQKSIEQTVFILTSTLSYIGDIIVGQQPADQLGGPLRIAQMSGQVASIGFVALLNLAAVLSVSIGLINLFPVPMLDGGHLLYYAIEAVRGKPLNERAQIIGFQFGLIALLALMIFVTWNDLQHLDVIG